MGQLQNLAIKFALTILIGVSQQNRADKNMIYFTYTAAGGGMTGG